LFSPADFFGSGFWFWFLVLVFGSGFWFWFLVLFFSALAELPAAPCILAVCLRRWPFLAFLSVYQLRPCAGRHLLSLPPRRKESKQRKRAATASP
jgi:hypothetical protein